MRVARIYITIIWILAAVLSASAQSVTYNHDESVMNQLQTTEVSYAGPDMYHKLFHNDYREDADRKIYSKQQNRFWVYGAVNKQGQSGGFAEKIDSAYTARAKVELANMLDRQLDVEWGSTSVGGVTFGGHGEKIRRQQALFQKYIQRISFWGGSYDDVEYWNNIYHAIDEGINAIRDAYMPNSSRKAQYIAIYDELCQRIKELLTIKEQWIAARDLRNLRSATTLSRVDARRAALDAHGRWKMAWNGRRNGSGGGAAPSGGINVGGRVFDFDDEDSEDASSTVRHSASASASSAAYMEGRLRYEQYKQFKASIQ